MDEVEDAKQVASIEGERNGIGLGGLGFVAIGLPCEAGLPIGSMAKAVMGSVAMDRPVLLIFLGKASMGKSFAPLEIAPNGAIVLSGMASVRGDGSVGG